MSLVAYFGNRLWKIQFSLILLCLVSAGRMSGGSLESNLCLEFPYAPFFLLKCGILSFFANKAPLR